MSSTDRTNNPMIQLASASEQYGSFVETDAAFAGASQLSYNAPAPTQAPVASVHSTTSGLSPSAQGITSFHLPTTSVTNVNTTHTSTATTSVNSRSAAAAAAAAEIILSPPDKKKRKTGGGSKQHQLPMFLTKTYHMIEKCDPDIATWSPNGDNFVVKNVEKFASSILPQYFKHSNFSSFARQLNFYGFRKLKAEPILTADYDARTASYVRFYHEKFQKDKPELLVHIKRATKSDVQSKDDVESLRAEIQHLNDVISNMSNDFDRRIAELSFEMNTKYNNLFNKFSMMQQQQQHPHPHQQGVQVPTTVQGGQGQLQQTPQQPPQKMVSHHPAAQQPQPTTQQTLSPAPVQGAVSNHQGVGTTVTAYPSTTTIANSITSSTLTVPKKSGTGMDNLAQACLTLKSPALPPQPGSNVVQASSGLTNFQLK